MIKFLRKVFTKPPAVSAKVQSTLHELTKAAVAHTPAHVMPLAAHDVDSTLVVGVDTAVTAVPFVKKFYVQRVEDGRFYFVDQADKTKYTWVDHVDWATDFGSAQAVGEARRFCPYVTRMFDLIVPVHS